ncbi:hypothetical protein [Desulfogranum japonicum]|uniref:hypothetical protein n=1 Tax=Desulfogranum japonicum TaxID=231447 RepID=UPI00041B4DBD|nr:hypothetical protein [Desulfogranum japonicum]
MHNNPFHAGLPWIVVSVQLFTCWTKTVPFQLCCLVTPHRGSDSTWKLSCIRNGLHGA